MRREHEAAIRIWAAQNGVQHKTAFDRDPHGMPLRAIAAQGAAADCKQEAALIDGFATQCLLAD